MKTPDSSAPRRCHCNGFSLVELILALSLYTGGALVLVALLPESMDAMRKASSRSLERQLAQTIIGELMLSEWALLHQLDASSSDNHSTLRYFDDQGMEQVQFEDSTIFSVRIRILPRDVNVDQDRSLETIPFSLHSSHTLPDDEEIHPSTNQHARRAVLEITDLPLKDFDFDDPKNHHRFRQYGTILANLKNTDAL